MNRLLTIEWLKLKHLSTLKVILIVYAILLPLIFYCLSLMPVYEQVYNHQIYQFPDVYHYVTYISSFFNLLIGVIIVVFTCNEIKYKTQRQNLIDGLSKKELILSKFYVVALLSIFITLYTFLIAVIFGFSNGSTDIFNGIRYIGFYQIATFGYFIFAFFLANLLKNPALSIVFYLLSTFLEGMTGLFAKDYSQFFPLSTFSTLIPMPVIPDGFEYAMTEMQRASLGLFYVFVFLYVSYYILTKRDV
ncbi:ABC transporter permease [Crocinitomicaceae bacterium]|nr:ABC transporter permease subunit [Flavobacteriales bacterium]MDC0459966.1 ABC transporter permease [Crocinitomicaceae bacterium]MDC1266489.1 ABC transporter permease [Crocinitomicaceae bacterium]MDO7609633.1 ABC transporter permease [Crocinitomicaceae bacterium]